MSAPSPTLALLASKPGSRFSFTCGPCGRFEAWSGAEMVAKHGGEITFENLKRTFACPHCGMPVDGDFRRLDYHRTEGDGFGWSGVR